MAGSIENTKNVEFRVGAHVGALVSTEKKQENSCVETTGSYDVDFKLLPDKFDKKHGVLRFGQLARFGSMACQNQGWLPAAHHSSTISVFPQENLGIKGEFGTTFLALPDGEVAAIGGFNSVLVYNKNHLTFEAGVGFWNPTDIQEWAPNLDLNNDDQPRRVSGLARVSWGL
jgi:hypothetical protein